MLSEIKYWPVNWIDGMKVSRHHFTATDNAVLDKIRDTASMMLTTWNYGVLPPEHADRRSLELIVTESGNNRIRLRLNQCRAITSGGCRVEIIDATLQGMGGPLETEFINATGSSTFDVLLLINPFAGKPAGQPDPSEIPPRHPSLLPECRLQVLPSEQVNTADLGRHYLHLGRLLVRGAGELALDDAYIPPCTSVISHQALIAVYRQWYEILQATHGHCIKIIQNIVTRNQNARVAENVKYVTERMLNTFSGMLFSFRTLTPQQPPVVMVSHIADLASVIHGASFCVPEREQLVNYFGEWLSMSAGDFDGMMQDVASLRYNHLDMQSSLRMCSYFLTTFSGMLQKLSLLDILKGKDPERTGLNVLIEATQNQPAPEPASQPKEKKSWWQSIEIK